MRTRVVPPEELKENGSLLASDYVKPVEGSQLLILLDASSGDDCWYGCALARLDEAQVKGILSHRELFQMVKSRDARINEMYFWMTCDVTFYENADLGEILSEEEEKEYDGERVLIIPYERELGEFLGDEVRTECDQIVVDEKSVRFYALGKHTDYAIETADLTYDWLLEALTKKS